METYPLPCVHEVGIIRWLPHLRKINDQDVTDLERADACNLQAALCHGKQGGSQHIAARAALHVSQWIQRVIMSTQLKSEQLCSSNLRI